MGTAGKRRREARSLPMKKAVKAASLVPDQLDHFQTMTAGALSRTVAQTLMHPVNTFKTILQMKGSKLHNLTPERLLRGADAQFVMSLPHGAMYFYVIEEVKDIFSKFWPRKFNFFSDFVCSSISTIVCSVVSTPQMVITDRLMAGIYPSFPVAVRSILRQEGVGGFYSGWFPALVQKIPSYGLTWMFFQQMKRKYSEMFRREPTSDANFGLGAAAAAAAVCVMIPMDTVKTRLVLQVRMDLTISNTNAENVSAGTHELISMQGFGGNAVVYTGVRDCFVKVFREEGLGAFYISLLPRLASVVPMISIQYGAYEFIKVPPPPSIYFPMRAHSTILPRCNFYFDCCNYCIFNRHIILTREKSG